MVHKSSALQELTFKSPYILTYPLTFLPLLYLETNSMRKHQPIWEQLKLTSTVSIAAEEKLHARIVKAVIKEKSSDLAWKYLQLDKGKKWKISYTKEGKLITFKLIDISEQIAINLNNL